MLEGISLDLAIESFSFFFITSLMSQMELRVPQMLHFLMSFVKMMERKIVLN